MVDERGVGRTTIQLAKAPRGATYVWCNPLTLYPRKLAEHLGRTDLRIVSPAWLGNVAGFQGNVVLDHALVLRTAEELNSVSYLRLAGCQVITVQEALYG